MYYVSGSAVFHRPLRKLVLLGVSESTDGLRMFQVFLKYS